MSQDQDQIFALVAADRSSPPPPDLALLRAGGRRRLLRRRIAVGAAGLAVVAAIAVPVAVLDGDGSGRAVDDVPAVTEPARPTRSPDASPDASAPASPYRPDMGSVRISGGVELSGEYEQGDLIGTVLDTGSLGDVQEVLYAASGPVLDQDGTGEALYVATGVRDGSRILRTITALSPLDQPQDQIKLYDGARIDYLPGREPYVHLIGSVPGDVAVSVTGPDGNASPVTSTSTSVLPGYTVFSYRAPWDDSWDATQLAPLTVTTGDGRRAQVRERSWSG